MRMPDYTPGVPNPYFYQNRAYPSRAGHGGDWRRPVFGYPIIARPENILVPGYDLNRGAPQPPISGLGAVNSSWDTGSGIFRPGGYGGGVFDNNISGLGSLGRGGRSVRGLGADADYPWRIKSTATAGLQEATNAALAENGMCPIVVDGKLGGATCGARLWLTQNDKDDRLFQRPSACVPHESEYTAPKSKSSGCGSSSGGGGALVVQPASAAALPQFSESGMSSSTKRTLGFALGGLLAIGAVVMLRRKR